MQQNTAAAIWHRFDISVGIDVDAPNGW